MTPELIGLLGIIGLIMLLLLKIPGYTVANDYAIRDYLENYYRPNLRVKNRDGCTPIGPWLVDKKEDK